MSYLSHSGANVPRHFRSRERKFQGAKVPGSESSIYGTFALGGESTWERKFQLPPGASPWTTGQYATHITNTSHFMSSNLASLVEHSATTNEVQNTD